MKVLNIYNLIIYCLLEYEEKNTNSRCFWCNTENLEVHDVNKANPIKRYSDSPNSTIKLNETISNNL